ncbi:unnamed protein product [marine sediment metagenome]|uniref:Uncharacterized protein n=1 Tax=marine sediment metagenome TaxID=412755 RepID=X1RT04_9ZZZZ
MTRSPAVKLEREKRKRDRDQRNWEREKLFYERVLTPNVTRLLLIMGIIAYSTYVARSERDVGPVQSALAAAGPGLGIPIIAADAGITDKYALAAISGVGLGYTGMQTMYGWAEYAEPSTWVKAIPGLGWIYEALT